MVEVNEDGFTVDEQQVLDLKHMMNTPGWEVLRQLLRQHLNERELSPLRRLSTINEVLGDQYDKGYIMGVQQSLLLPEQILQQAEFDRELRVREEDPDQFDLEDLM